MIKVTKQEIDDMLKPFNYRIDCSQPVPQKKIPGYVGADYPEPRVFGVGVVSIADGRSYANTLSPDYIRPRPDSVKKAFYEIIGTYYYGDKNTAYIL